MLDLRQRVAVVTGGASGIGRATALALASLGAAVMIGDRDLERALAVSSEISSKGGSASAIELEVSNSESVNRLVREAERLLGRLDILIHSAGIGVELNFLDTSEADWRRLLDIDLTGTFLCCQAAARCMKKQGTGGRLITLASAAGIRGGTGRAAYGAAKGGVIALVRVMAVELARYGITANALAPGAIETELVARMHDAETRRIYRAGIPLDRYGTPAEVAAAAVFLASDQASYITGETLIIDGGFVAAGVMKSPKEV